MPLVILNASKAAYETEPRRAVKALPYYGPDNIIVDGEHCTTKRIDAFGKDEWRGRRRQAPWPKYVFEDAATAVLDKIGAIRREDKEVGEPYFEGNPRIVGIWGTGSGAAGRYNASSDVDVWVEMEGLTNLGEKYLDQDVIEAIGREAESSDDAMVYVDGKPRRIDAVIVGRPPPVQACKYRLTGDFSGEIEEFNEND